MRKFLLGTVHDYLIYFLIAFNAVILFCSAYPGLSERTTFVLFALDYFCTVYFVYEMTIKLSVLGPTEYFTEAWNRFDFAIVFLSSPMLLTPVIAMRGFGVIVVLRTARLLRLLRLFQFIPDVDRLWRGVKRALKASVGVFSALFIYMYILTLFATYLFGGYSPEYFGDPMTSIYSMLQLFTVEGWYEIPNAVAAGSSPMVAFGAKLFFSLTVLTAGVLGMSLANAVFVDEMVIDNTDELEAKVDELNDKIDRLHERFDA